MFKRLLLRLLGVICISTILPISLARADWITVDTPQGAGTAVLDTVRGMMWLRLSVTENWTFAQVESALLPSGQLANYRYATGSDLNCGLLPNYFNLDVECAGSFITLGNAATVEQFFDLFGLYFNQPYHFAYYELLLATSHHRQAFISQFFRYNAPEPHYEYDSQMLTIQMDQPAYHWLVATSQQVPEPRISLLFGLGAIGLIVSRKRRSLGLCGCRVSVP